jgi:hypothetical protein
MNGMGYLSYPHSNSIYAKAIFDLVCSNRGSHSIAHTLFTDDFYKSCVVSNFRLVR